MQCSAKETAIKIRAFEELILDLFSQNKLSGTTHTYIGQEATAVAVMPYVRAQDKVFSNHRCHGHYLAYGGSARSLLAEIMSKPSGLCGGRGGSQHIHFRNFYTNGIQGGIVPNALGMAMADRMRGSDANTVVFLGDGTLGQGVVYESLNIAGLYAAPVVFVIEDNAYAMSTPRTDAVSGDIKTRIEGFNIRAFEIESTDVDALTAFFGEVFAYARTKQKPVCAIVHNYRLGAHSKGDDTRDPDEIALHRAEDPMLGVRRAIGDAEYTRIYNAFRTRFEGYVRDLESEQTPTVLPSEMSAVSCETSLLAKQSERYVERVREGLRAGLAAHPEMVIFGEDVRDPYGGAFKVTKGLSTAYADRVWNMPISEACMAGLCVGMAMNQALPVTEMMFGDFLTLGFDQLLNHASKYGWVYGDCRIPMVVRAPMGAKRGYGPTHSQSLEKFMIGIPGIRVLSLCAPMDPAAFYDTLFSQICEPTVVIENKTLYGQKTLPTIDGVCMGFAVRELHADGFPTFVFSPDPDGMPDVCLVTYGGMTQDALDAADQLMMQDEIQVNVIVLTQLSPLPLADLRTAIGSVSRVAVLEEGTLTGGIGAEIVARCAESGVGKAYCRIASPNMPIPNGIAMERQIIPDKETVVNRIRSLVAARV